MIAVGTELRVIDNSGAKKVKCIKILGGSFKKYGFVGSLLVISVKKINPLKKIKKGEIYKAVLIAIKKKKIRKNGSFVFFDVNGAVIVNNKQLPTATRILRPVMAELRKYNYGKILSMARSAI
jgi:large subunit ribosomal protein L14